MFIKDLAICLFEENIIMEIKNLFQFLRSFKVVIKDNIAILPFPERVSINVEPPLNYLLVIFGVVLRPVLLPA